ncbi:prelamin-A/C-like isoform X2 [Syngnathus typhle]|uniref:prelamin-A/C-like isoform X2 n=1 Tax=Syngnathus typhle TaxID=161592 RepID=UPI002A6989F6|nr:prelamin-A/C-like isoform X2 [Syngnathus typhle]
MATPENTPQDAYNELRAIYKTELAKARAALVLEATERERLQVELSKLRIDFDELEARDTKKESDLAKARAALVSEATERKRLQVEFSKLKIDFDELEARDTKKESDLAKARAALDSEATERERLQVKLSKLKIDFDELEARKSHYIQILKDELEFEKKLHSADLRMVQSQHESRMVLEAGQKVKDLEEALSTERERTQNKEERVRQTMSASKKRKRPKDSEGLSLPRPKVAQQVTVDEQQATVDEQQVTLDEVDSYGKYVRLRNTVDEDQNLGNWQVKLQIGSSAPIVFKFAAEFILKAHESVTIWAADAGRNHNPPSDLVWETQSNWGPVGQVHFTLINANGEEIRMSKATGARLEDDDGNSTSTVG